jgi:alpha-L-rhamnosidase
MDDTALWEDVTRAIRLHRPAWSPTRIAEAAWPYLDLPLPELARCVGMSIPTDAERRLRSDLDALAAR